MELFSTNSEISIKNNEISDEKNTILKIKNKHKIEEKLLVTKYELD